jgi:hypothetical protein
MVLYPLVCWCIALAPVCRDDYLQCLAAARTRRPWYCITPAVFCIRERSPIPSSRFPPDTYLDALRGAVVAVLPQILMDLVALLSALVCTGHVPRVISVVAVFLKLLTVPVVPIPDCLVR